MNNTKMNRGTCSENAINPKAVYDFIKHCENNNLGINSFMLIKGSTVVSEGYHSPYTNEDIHVLYSLSKSITATALGFAVDEGKISLDDSICKFFDEYDKHGMNKSITIRHLVTMTAGKMIGMAKNRHQKDWIKIFFDAPFVFKPGSKFLYTNDNFYLLSAIISKVYKETLVDFLYPRLFKPLGIEKPLWETDKFGYAAGGWGLYMCIEDLAKIMVCYCQNGKYNGKQVIPPSWIKSATAYQVDTVKKGHIDVTKGYGFGFWRTSLPNTYRAYGLHGQMGYVFEDKDTVLVINSGISKDEKLSSAIIDLYKTLWDEPQTEYEEKLSGLLSSFGDKDNLPVAPRNSILENKYDKKTLKTKSSRFASMLNATISTMHNEKSGSTDRFSLSLDYNNDLFLLWKENTCVNKIKLGMKNIYESTKIEINNMKFTAFAKAAWTEEKVLTVLIRIAETCHVRKLDFDFSDEKHIVVKNNSFPDLPELAAHYMDFSGIPLPEKIEKLLIKYVAPGVLLLGEPNFKIKL